MEDDVDRVNETRERVEELFHAALELRDEERERLLEDRGRSDPSVAAEARELLAALVRFRAPLTTRIFGGTSVESQDRTGRGTSRLPVSLGRVGPYEIMGILGEGGQGTVFRARDTRLDRVVALKVLRVGTPSPEVVARFRVEQRILATMNHVNVARIYDARWESGSLPFLVMEYVPGEPITRYADSRRLDPNTRLEIFEQVCRGVEHAHQRGVIHRDLKPSNIIVSDDDMGRPVSKIIDFGIAKAMGPASEELTHTGQVLGTPLYMSPEQIDGEPDLDVRTDVYSLGIVLFELLTGARAFESLQVAPGTPLDKARRRGDMPIPRPSDRLRETRGGRSRALRRDLDWIVQRAVEKERANRYSSVGAFLEDLERFRRHEPVSAGPPSFGRRAGAFVRRHRALVTVVTLMISSLALGLVSTLIQYRRAEQHMAQFVREADLRLLPAAIAESQELWPATQALVPQYEDWLTRVRDMVSRLDEHSQCLSEWRSLGLDRGENSGPDDHPLRAKYEDLRAHCDRLREIDEPGGLLEEIEARLRLAMDVEEMTISGAAARRSWTEAIRAIRESEHYGGLELTPQLGLLPLGCNPATGLWEFWHVQTGAPPEPAPAGGTNPWRLTPETGVVFVLLPGGSFLMGAQSENAAAPHYDSDARAHEGPVVRATLAPFFMAKYEITQGQSVRAGSNPSYFPPPNRHGDNAITLVHPIEDVPWYEVRRGLLCFGMDLPSEAQWEYAARAGTTARYVWGDRVEDLQGRANLCDAYCQANGGTDQMRYVLSIDDGYTVHAPVGSYAPNGFGLFDMLGNVAEWCVDPYGDLSTQRDPNSGVRVVGSYGQIWAYRGGGWYSCADDIRVAWRDTEPDGYHFMNIGGRAAMPVRRTAEFPPLPEEMTQP